MTPRQEGDKSSDSSSSSEEDGDNMMTERLKPPPKTRRPDPWGEAECCQWGLREVGKGHSLLVSTERAKGVELERVYDQER